MTWLDFGGQRSKIKVTADNQGGEGIHFDTGVLKSIFWLFNYPAFPGGAGSLKENFWE